MLLDREAIGSNSAVEKLRHDAATGTFAPTDFQTQAVLAIGFGGLQNLLDMPFCVAENQFMHGASPNSSFKRHPKVPSRNVLHCPIGFQWSSLERLSGASTIDRLDTDSCSSVGRAPSSQG